MVSLVSLFIWLLCIGLLFWLAYYLVNNLAPEPSRKILNVVLVVIFVLALVVFLLEYAAPLIGGLSSGVGPRRLR